MKFRRISEEIAVRHLANPLLKTNGPEDQLHQSPVNPNRILVVDDDDAIRTMVERVLRREAFHVDSARDGHEAIEKLARNEYSTVLLDLMMPRVDGHGVLRYLEVERQGPKPAVIIMTANLPGAADATHAEPVFRVVSKPFDIRQLVTHVRECLQPPSHAGQQTVGAQLAE